MAAGYLPVPGTEYGPCPQPCEHIDCSATRQEAVAPCPYCGESIGYDRAFYREHDHLVHASCALDAIEVGRRVKP